LVNLLLVRRQLSSIPFSFATEVGLGGVVSFSLALKVLLRGTISNLEAAEFKLVVLHGGGESGCRERRERRGRRRRWRGRRTTRQLDVDRGNRRRDDLDHEG
jgi:hypothetical protein